MRSIFKSAVAILPLVAAVLRVEAETYKVYVNDTPIAASVIETNGTLYLPLHTMAKALGVKVAVDGDEIRIASSTNIDQKTSSTGIVERAQRFGTVKGTLTYFFNQNNGDKPDVGAKVILLTEEQAESLEKATGGTADNPIPEGIDWIVLSLRFPFYSSTGNKLCMDTVADGNGNFSFDRVPVGRYLVVSQSKHCPAMSSRDIMGKVNSSFAEVKDGEIVDLSHDFGIRTAY